MLRHVNGHLLASHWMRCGEFLHRPVGQNAGSAGLPDEVSPVRFQLAFLKAVSFAIRQSHIVVGDVFGFLVCRKSGRRPIIQQRCLAQAERRRVQHDPRGAAERGIGGVDRNEIKIIPRIGRVFHEDGLAGLPAIKDLLPVRAGLEAVGAGFVQRGSLWVAGERSRSCRSQSKHGSRSAF